MALDPDQYKLSEIRHQAIFEQRIKRDLFSSTTPSKQPIAIILGGQPGAGKSALVTAATKELNQRGGAVEIIGDDLRDYHPNYRRLMSENDKTGAFYTDRDTGRWIEKAIAEAKYQRANLVIEGTMRDSNKVAATMKSLREAGYKIDARALAVTAKLSELGIMLRYEGQKSDRGSGRMTTPESHKAGYDGMLGTLDRIETEKLADRVTVYRRGAEIIYTNTLKDGNWEHQPNARAIVEAERARPLNLQERRNYLAGFDKLATMLAKPERQASAEEVRNIETLRQQARISLETEIFRQEFPEKTAQQLGYKIQSLCAAEPGKTYTGVIISVRQQEVIQATEQGLVSHQRQRLIDSSTLDVGRDLEIAYPHGQVGLIRDVDEVQRRPEQDHQHQGPTFDRS